MQIEINSNFIREWCLETFPEHRLVSGGRELTTNSIFEADRKRHLSINIETGLWQDFKSGNKGNFIRLYAHVHGIPYQAAQNRLLTKHLDSFTWDEPIIEEEEVSGHFDTSHFIPLDLNYPMSKDPSKQGMLVWGYAFARHLFSSKDLEITYYYSNELGFRDRLIIPYEYEDELFFYQARTISNGYPRYTNPETHETGIKSSNILMPYDEDADFLVICEGPTDAKSLKIQGINATCTQGSNVSYNQAEMLKDFPGKLIMGYDHDEAGVRGISTFNALRKELRIPELHICPPPPLMDWNRAHVKRMDLQSYIKGNTTNLNWFKSVQDSLSAINY